MCAIYVVLSLCYLECKHNWKGVLGMKLRTETFCLISCPVSFWEPCFVVIILHNPFSAFPGGTPL